MKKTLKTLVLSLVPAFVFASTPAAADEQMQEHGPMPALADPPAPAKASATLTAAQRTAITGSLTPRVRVWTWDMNIDGAFGRIFPDSADSRWTGFGRVRAGVMHIHDSFYFMAGPTYEYSNLQRATFGLQAEMMHVETGLWIQAGGLLDIAPHPGFMAAAGWSLFGVEVQGREYDKGNMGFAPSVYGKLRLPVGVIARVFSK